MASSFWEEFKDLFKTDKQLEQERQQKINDALNAEKDLSAKLAELDKQYQDSLPKEEKPDVDALFPKDNQLKEIEYTPASDEDLISSAQKEIDASKSTSKNNIDARYEKAIEALEDNKKSAKNNLANSYENLSKLYSELKEKANNDSLRRGMARSSVATNRVDALDKEYIESATQAEKSYMATLASIDDSLAALAREKDVALEELDLKSASDRKSVV